MKKIFKNQKGIAAIAVIIIAVLSVAAGGTAFLGVRALVTGDPFLQPFEDLGLIELEEDDDEKNESDKKDSDEDNKENDKTTSVKGEESSLLLSEVEDEGVECYTIVIDLKEVADGMVPVIEELMSMYMSAGDMSTDSVEGALVDESISSILELAAEMFTDCEIILDCYADGNDIKQLLITIPYEQFVENVYYGIADIEELMIEMGATESDLGFDYESYEECLADFEDTAKDELTTEGLRDALSEELGTEYQDIIDNAECVIEDGKIQISLDLTSIDIESYISENSAELEELGIDPDNVVESAVTAWNEYIDEVGYDGLIETAMSTVMGAYSLMGY